MPQVTIGDAVRVSDSQDTKAIGQFDSTTQYVLIPRMTTTQRDAISSPATGALIWNTTTGQLEEYDSGWSGVGSGSTPFSDSVAIIKGSADATKLFRIEVDGFTTGTTRVMTPPNQDFTPAISTLANIASVAIPVSLISDTDNTDDLGSSGVKWANTYTNRLYLEEGSAPSTPSSGDYVLYSKVSGGGQLYGKNDDGIEKQVSVGLAILRDEKTSGTAGGTSSTTTWNSRNLNTETYDPDAIVSISSNQFTPIAGTYIIDAWATAGPSTNHRLRLYNVTGAASVEEGLGVLTGAVARETAHLVCSFTANGSDAYRIDHYTAVGQVTTGLGSATNDGSAEVYLEIRLLKVA